MAIDRVVPRAEDRRRSSSASPTPKAAPPARARSSATATARCTRATPPPASPASTTWRRSTASTSRARLTWAFEFEDQPYFAGFRALASNGVDLPVLNVFRMFGKMGGQRVAVKSTGDAGLEAILKDGVRGAPDVSALASLEGKRLSVMAWHYHDDDVPGPDAAVALAVGGLPLGRRRGAPDALPDRREPQQRLRALEADGLADRAERRAVRAAPGREPARADGGAGHAARRRRARPRCSSPCPARRSPSSCSSGEDRRSRMIRWRIAVLVAVAIAISYLDRQALPVAIQAIARDIPVTNEQFSQLQSAFLIAYALMYAGGGKLMDVLGTRRGFTVIMVFWSLACASHGLAASVGTLAAQPVPAGHRRRRRLPRRDAGGGGVVPGGGALDGHGHHQRGHRRRHDRGAAADRARAERRGLALGLLPHRGRSASLWTLWWQRDYFPPERHPRLGEAERREIQSVLGAASAAATASCAGWTCCASARPGAS